ncbi:MAG: NAD(P)/FAD-dependent oxidoreductase [Gammaproteobacteria bacterium]|jgi:2-polyprenyl-6-methoxyphenol hydroxylase-like FAD-dependent oxidoreductase
MTTDIAIIGAGFTGLSLAHSLLNNDLDLKITIIERLEKYPNNFRSDKIGTHQARLMRELGIFKYMLPSAAPMGEIVVYDGKKETLMEGNEQYGLDYTATIHNLRKMLPDSVEFIHAEVNDIADSQNGKVICLSNNTNIHAKLVAVCTGGGNKLIERLGIEKHRSEKLKSLTFGFDIKRKDNSPFDVNGRKAFTYYNTEFLDGVYFIMFFPLGDRIRCNLFSEVDPKSTAAKDLRHHMLESLPRYFPDLYDKIGEIELTSSVQVMPTKLYRVKNFARERLIILGDEFQGVNPGTGTGFSKILSEINALARTYIPRWLTNNDFSKNEISRYYYDKNKLNSDRSSLQQWIYLYREANRKNDLFTKIKQRMVSYGYFSLIKYL